jgi:hypothetical protein
MSTLQVNRIIPLTGDSVYIQGAVIDSASFAATASYASSVGVNFVQSSPATTWTINHNLNNQYPLVQTYNSSSATIIPQSIVGTSINTVTVTFSTAISGYARVV